MKPKHFKNKKSWDRYILKCALQDRLHFLDCIECTNDEKLIEETVLEIRAIREMMGELKEVVS